MLMRLWSFSKISNFKILRFWWFGRNLERVRNHKSEDGFLSNMKIGRSDDSKLSKSIENQPLSQCKLILFEGNYKWQNIIHVRYINFIPFSWSKIIFEDVTLDTVIVHWYTVDEVNSFIQHELKLWVFPFDWQFINIYFSSIIFHRIL